MNNLCRPVKEAKHDLLVINDSDVRVEKGLLARCGGTLCRS
jgi:hypothetical protein